MTGLFLSVLLPSALAIGQPFSQVLASLTRTVILPRAADPLFLGPLASFLALARLSLVGSSGLWFVLLESAFPFDPASFHSCFSFLFSPSLLLFFIPRLPCRFPPTQEAHSFDFSRLSLPSTFVQPPKASHNAVFTQHTATRFNSFK